MFIRHLEVTNYMIHQSTKVDLHPVTVFAGSNNSGKSALFDALLNFSMVSRGKLSQAFGPGPYSYHSTRHHGSSRQSRIRYKVQMSAQAEAEAILEYSVSYSQRGGGMQDVPEYEIHDERLSRVDTGEELYNRAEDACAIGGVVNYIGYDRSLFAAIRRAQVEGKYTETDALVTEVARDISRMNKFRLVPINLRSPSRLPDTTVESPEAEQRTPRLDYNGEELAGVLYYLAEIDSPVLAEIVGRLRDTVTGFEGFEFNAVGTERIGFSARFADARGVVPAAKLSDGTLSLIGHLTLLLSPSRPPVLMLEEPENGLTPRSTRAIYEAVVEATKTESTPRSQVLISSHSPYIVVEAWNGDARDFIYQTKVADGKSVMRLYSDIIAEQGIHLQKDKKGQRETLGLSLADLIMDGYWS